MQHLSHHNIAAGKKVTEDEVENMIESENPAIFTQDVRCYFSVWSGGLYKLLILLFRF